jgi:hypothetical protein
MAIDLAGREDEDAWWLDQDATECARRTALTDAERADEDARQNTANDSVPF